MARIVSKAKYKVGQVVKRALVSVALWLESVAVRFRESVDHCEMCKRSWRLSTCPCGMRVCEWCQDYGIYSDEVCCKSCGAEIRQGWRDCPEHVYGEPYTNEVEAEIVECVKCSFTKFAPVRPLTKREIGGSNG